MSSAKLRKFVDGRKGLLDRISEECRGCGNIVWFHAASYGEFEEARPVVERLRKADPDARILVTFFSPTGYEAFRNYPAADWVFYLPLDTRRNARRFMEAVRPSKLVISISDFWFNFIYEAFRKNVDVYVISAFFPERSFYFKWYGFPYRRMFRKCFRHIFVKDNRTLELLRAEGIDSVSRVGDPRMDRVIEIASEDWHDAIVEEWCRGSKVFVGGSILPGEDEELIAALANSHPGDKFLIVPHEVDNRSVQHLRSLLEVPSSLYSECGGTPVRTNVLIVDTVGILSRLYRYGWGAYIGSGFTKYSPHSVIEPAVYGMPVVFGPIYDHNTHCGALIAEGGGFSVPGVTDFLAWYDRMKSDESRLASASRASLEYCMSARGAAEEILREIFPHSTFQ